MQIIEGNRFTRLAFMQRMWNLLGTTAKGTAHAVEGFRVLDIPDLFRRCATDQMYRKLTYVQLGRKRYPHNPATMSSS